MLKQWPRGTTLTDARLLSQSVGSAGIYLSIFDIDGSLRPEWISPAAIEIESRCALDATPISVRGARRSIASRRGAPRLHIFGLAYAGPEFIQIFGRLGTHADLHIYTLNPVANSGRRAKSRSAHPPRLGPLFVDGRGRSFELGASEDNLALRYWGRGGPRVHSGLLNELTECDFDEHFCRACTDWCNSVVARARPASHSHAKLGNPS